MELRCLWPGAFPPARVRGIDVGERVQGHFCVVSLWCSVPRHNCSPSPASANGSDDLSRRGSGDIQAGVGGCRVGKLAPVQGPPG
jgi:hypothetical protein